LTFPLISDWSRAGGGGGGGGGFGAGGAGGNFTPLRGPPPPGGALTGASPLAGGRGASLFLPFSFSFES